ncbi:aminotransferase class I/II-fold pyridoxal phosphate-dependent enzyme [Tranquillimonas rosea]|uniref:aminotransferase class I/II-fold pyridoxal phosphate-dependent enzyme n=1 Tax=Tranquillimonas rosea TaxID=641238 RepID=UPI003BA92F48
MTPVRDHGGALDDAIARWGGDRDAWLDLSTGINPVPYPVGAVSYTAWETLPDRAATERLKDAARAFWSVPPEAAVIAVPGASAAIARLPALCGTGPVHIPEPTYNEHRAAFEAQGRPVTGDPAAEVHVYVHPNNPDGRLWPDSAIGGRAVTVIDESFCDVRPDNSHVRRAAEDGVVVLKSFGKFWGLAGARLGVVIGDRAVLAPDGRPGLADLLGPWAASGPALEIGARALEDSGWAATTRRRLAEDARRLDGLMTGAGAAVAGGTDLFRLYEVDDAVAWRDRLAAARILGRIFPYSSRWLRLGLPGPDDWDRLEAAL